MSLFINNIYSFFGGTNVSVYLKRWEVISSNSYRILMFDLHNYKKKKIYQVLLLLHYMTCMNLSLSNSQDILIVCFQRMASRICFGASTIVTNYIICIIIFFFHRNRIIPLRIFVEHSVWFPSFYFIYVFIYFIVWFFLYCVYCV